jgi:hypothetical protein
LAYAFAQGNSAPNPPKLTGQPAQAPITTGGAKPPAKTDESNGTLPLVVSILSLAVSGYTAFYLYGKNYELSKVIAERTVTIEAQTLLLEINKQFVACPDLFAIYDDYPGRANLLAGEPKLLAKLRAMAYMHLNVFEIVFAVLPGGTSRKTWVKYFEDSLNRCSIIQEELDANPEIYHADLMAAYRSWRCSHPAAANRTAVLTTPPSATSPTSSPTPELL